MVNSNGSLKKFYSIFSDNWFHFHTIASRDYFVTVCRVLMGLGLAAGIYFRLKGLGKSPLAIDEYYIASSVRNILEHGLPQFDCGGYYTRGLLLQYMVAPFFKFGSNDEFYFRLITVTFNMATLPALYLLARHIAGILVACIVVIMFSLSVWETEMARFARMYAPFQMLFVWYVYFLYKVIVLRESSANRWMYVISFLSVFVYEGAVFLALLNFLPFFMNNRKANFREYLPSIIVLILVLFNLIGFRRLDAGVYLPNDVSIGLTGESNLSVLSNLPIELPVLLFTTLPSNVAWMMIFLIPLTVSGMAVWSLIANCWKEIEKTLNSLLCESCVRVVF